MVNFFTNSELKRVELSDGFWVDVVSSMSYQEFSELFKNQETDDSKFLQKIIKNWNLKDEKGADVPCTVENIGKLSSNVVLPIASTCIPFYMPEKKILTPFTEK